jgi:transposase-like protein
MKKIGFCKQCLRNVPHILFYQWPIFRIMNRFPALAESLPLASWHCCGCEKSSYRLRVPDPNSHTDVTSTDMSDVTPWRDRKDPNQRFGLLFRRKKNADVVPGNAAVENKGKSESAMEHVGNFLRSDESLLVRKARAKRYSDKFREGVVSRILSGALTISQARKELGVSERDLLDWINDRIMRKDQKIAKLSQVVESVKQLTIEQDLKGGPASNAEHIKVFPQDPQEDLPRRDSRPHGATIDGRVN